MPDRLYLLGGAKLPVDVGTVLVVAGGVLWVVATLWMLVVAARSGRYAVLWIVGLLLLPIVPIVFLIRHWQRARWPFLVNLAALGLVIGGVAASPRTGQGTTVSATARARGWTALASGVFMSSCKKDASETLCRCVLDWYQERYTLAEFEKLADDDAWAEEATREAARACVLEQMAAGATTPSIRAPGR